MCAIQAQQQTITSIIIIISSIAIIISMVMIMHGIFSSEVNAPPPPGCLGWHAFWHRICGPLGTAMAVRTLAMAVMTAVATGHRRIAVRAAIATAAATAARRGRGQCCGHLDGKAAAPLIPVLAQSASTASRMRASARFLCSRRHG